MNLNSMKLPVITFLLMLTLIISSCGKPENKEPISTDFLKFSAMYSNLKSSEKDEFWQKNKGAYVQWTGQNVIVNKVRPGFIAIEVRTPERKGYSISGYDFLVKKDNIPSDKLQQIKPGDIVSFKGKLKDEKGIFSDWILSDAEIIEVTQGKTPPPYEILKVVSGESYKTYWVFISDSSKENLLTVTRNFPLDHREELLSARSGFQIRFVDGKGPNEVAVYAKTPSLKLSRLTILNNGQVTDQIDGI